MIAYLIKSTICLALLYAVYRLFLEQEKMHRFNRFFLIFSLVFGLTIPVITLNWGAKQITPTQIAHRVEEMTAPQTSQSPQPLNQKEFAPQDTSSSSPLHPSLVWVYGIVAGIMIVRFFYRLRNLYAAIKSNRHLPYHQAKLVLCEPGTSPYSFFNYLFVDRARYESGRINEAVFIHELTHARQKHSLDILFIECLKIVFWFNPVIFFYKKSMQLNHEFLADEHVIQNTSDLRRYQRLLLKLQTDRNDLHLTSSISYPITKKRIMMMTKHSPKFQKRLKQAALMPLLAIFVVAFSTHHAKAQDVQSMSLTELIKAVNQKMKSGKSLSDAEKNDLRKLLKNMRQKLNDSLKLPPPPPPEPKDPEEALKQYSKSYQELSRAYFDIPAIAQNKELMQSAYKKVMTLYNKVDSLQNVMSENPPPPPPKPIEPQERLNQSFFHQDSDSSNQRSDTLSPPSNQSKRNEAYSKQVRAYIDIEPALAN